VGQWPGHVEKNGAQRAGRRHTVLLIHRPLLATPSSVCPFRKHFAIAKMRCDPTRHLLIATLSRKEKEIFDGKAKSTRKTGHKLEIISPRSGTRDFSSRILNDLKCAPSARARARVRSRLAALREI